VIIYKELCYKIVGAAMEVHRLLGPGFLEAVYETALAAELTKKQIPFKLQDWLKVMYKGEDVGNYKPDIIVDNKVILEIKATSCLVPRHTAQALHYLAATKLQLALLINFGASSLQFKRVVNQKNSR
jgi:GxxExxY protein